MTTFKQAYKFIRSRLKVEATTNRARTVHVLINLKSNNVNPYEGENRKQLLSILKRSKSWDGDVLYYFLRQYTYWAERPRRVAKFFNQYNNPAGPPYDLPF